MQSAIITSALVAVSILFAAVATCSTEKDQPLFPTSERRADFIIALMAVAFAFLAGGSV